MYESNFIKNKIHFLNLFQKELVSTFLTINTKISKRSNGLNAYIQIISKLIIFFMPKTTLKMVRGKECDESINKLKIK